MEPETPGEDPVGGGSDAQSSGGFAAARWEMFSVSAVWLVALIVLFVTDPPPMALVEGGDGDFVGDQTGIKFLVQFVVTMILAAFWLIGSAKASRSVLWKHVLVAFAFLVLGVGSLGGYMLKRDQWVCPDYMGYGPILIGDTLTKQGSDYMKDYPKATCEDILMDHDADPTLAFVGREVSTRYYLLIVWFAGTVVLFALSASTLLHAIGIKLRNTTGRTSSVEHPDTPGPGGPQNGGQESRNQGGET